MKQGITIIALLFVCLVSNAQEVKKASPVFLSTVCDGAVNDQDKELATFFYDPTTQVIQLRTDIAEALDLMPSVDSSGFEVEIDGMPFAVSTMLDIPDLNHMSSADNGETFVFDTVISCGDRESTTRVTYTYFYAPLTGQSQLAPIANFRLDFVVSIDPAILGIPMIAGCNEIVLRVQDAQLNLLRN